MLINVFGEIVNPNWITKVNDLENVREPKVRITLGCGFDSYMSYIDIQGKTKLEVMEEINRQIKEIK